MVKIGITTALTAHLQKNNKNYEKLYKVEHGQEREKNLKKILKFCIFFKFHHYINVTNQATNLKS